MAAAVSSALTLTLSGCSSDGTGHRPDPVPDRPDPKPGLVFRENPDWTLSHAQDVVVDDYGFKSDVDIISVNSLDDETYYLDVITADNFKNWYDSDLEAYIKDEPNYYNGELYKGSTEVTFDRMRSGSWLAVAFGVKNGEINGDYAVLRFTIQEDQPSEDFKRWLGKWTVKGASKSDPSREISYDLDITSSDADYLFYVTGWESGRSASVDMKDYGFETQYDRFTKTMLFKCLYLETETISGKDYDLCFYGNFIYDGSMGFTDMKKGDEQTVCDNIIVAESSVMSGDGRSATVDGLNFDFIQDNKTYRTKLTSMQYFDYPLDENDLGLYVKNSDIPVFPLTMTKVSDAASTMSVKVNAGRSMLMFRPQRRSPAHGIGVLTPVRTSVSSSVRRAGSR